ncbi:hypothetical protein AMQ84_26765 [Paenibacillus riograndensis]|uniref:Uncharacterized protein n=1 Tax=Paenibacillus riograndensis TaxID=483937 RepID=A0A132TJS6_9BACL|nr:hypothetical protein AMQ84_26765 [Paenibacillus riograndensis]
MLKSKSRVVVTNVKTKKKIVIAPSRLKAKQFSRLTSDIATFYTNLGTDSQFAADWESACNDRDRRRMRNLFGQSTFNDFRGSIQFKQEFHDRRRYHCCYLYFWWNDNRYSLDFCYPNRH